MLALLLLNASKEKVIIYLKTKYTEEIDIIGFKNSYGL